MLRGAKCSVVECLKPAVANSFCATHYKRWQRHGHAYDTRPADWGSREKHPCYKTYNWLTRRYMRSSEVCEEWVNDFWQFVRDVGEYPGISHKLARMDATQPYGPANCYWREKGVRKGSPEYRAAQCEYQRQYRLNTLRKQHDSVLRRYYGVGVDWYEQTLSEQGGLCAVCRRGERSQDPKTGKVRRLSVDHCHGKGHVRGLLCSDCNRGLGMFQHDPARMETAIAYLRAHSRS